MDSEYLDDHLRIIATADGSHTLYSQRYDAHYHSSHGAIQESKHVFIEHGLQYVKDHKVAPVIRILEVGMGTGLNVLLTALSAARSTIRYMAIEAHPVPSQVVAQLNYAQTALERNLFEKIHTCPWQQWTEIQPGFDLFKDNSMVEEVEILPHAPFDIIYYDAFGPGCQPHLWSAATLAHLVAAMRVGSILVTFCAQGAFKRALRSLGLTIERLPGPPGKREMTRATRLL